MQFHFPQYIDVEDKLFGPLTLKQAIFTAGGLGAMYFVYRLFAGYLFIGVPIIAGIAALTWALAFYPKEKLGKPFSEIVEAWIGYTTKSKLYTWKHNPKKVEVGKEEEFIFSQPTTTPSIPTGKLSSTSFTLDTRNPLTPEPEEDLKTRELP